MPSYILTLGAVKDYFSQLNPIAERIAFDIEDTKSKYGTLWNTLNANEQNDIINETLIRPEIALRYFESFATTSTVTPTTCASSNTGSLSKNSVAPTSCGRIPNNIEYTKLFMNPNDEAVFSHPSMDSLTAVILKKLGNTQQTTSITTKTNLGRETTNANNCYGYDGRNLGTYSVQKVSLKFIHCDDAGIAYRDEHSLPFSYRTKSQINLSQQQQHHQLYNTTEHQDEKPLIGRGECLLSATPLSNPLGETELSNYKKLQEELKKNLSSHNRMPPEENGIKLKQMKTSETISPAKTTTKLNTTNNVSEKFNKPISTGNIKNVPCDNMLMKAFDKKMVSTCKSATDESSHLNYAIYTDTYCEHGELSNLMQYVGSNSNSGILTTSSESATTSDDDRFDYEDDVDDEKTLCEDVKLLDNDINLRRGFDFLNNW